MVTSVAVARAQTPVNTARVSETPIVVPTPSPAPERDAMPGFSALVKPLVADFKQVGSRDNFWLIGLGAATAWSSHELDDNVAGNRWGNGTVARVLAPGRIVGGVAVQSSAAFATYLVGRVVDQPRIADVGAKLVRAQIVSQVMTQAVKFSAQRTRPDGTVRSFPSGHTASSFATATVLQSEFGWKAGLPAYAMATWVAASRVQTKKHYVSDVLAGATVGMLAGRSVTVGRGDMRFSMSPLAAPGGLGVSFVRIGSR